MSALEDRRKELLERRAKLQELIELQRECFKLELMVMNRGVHGKDITQSVELVASYFAVGVSDLLGTRRNREIAEARMWLYLLLFEHYRMSYSEIGRALKRDHGAVIHGVKAAKERIAMDKRDRETWALICERVAISDLASSNLFVGVNRNGNGKADKDHCGTGISV